MHGIDEYPHYHMGTKITSQSTAKLLRTPRQKNGYSTSVFDWEWKAQIRAKRVSGK